jgi:hypothetical protein
MSIIPLFLVSLAILATFQILLVRLVDPRGDFGTQIPPVLTQDSRRQKTHLFPQYAADVSVISVIVGSRRSMKLNPTELEAIYGNAFQLQRR